MAQENKSAILSPVSITTYSLQCTRVSLGNKTVKEKNISTSSKVLHSIVHYTVQVWVPLVQEVQSSNRKEDTSWACGASY